MSLWRKLVLFGAVAATVSMVDAAVPTRTTTSTLGRIRRPVRARPSRQTPPVTVIHTATKLGLGTTACTWRTDRPPGGAGRVFSRPGSLSARFDRPLTPVVL